MSYARWSDESSIYSYPARGTDGIDYIECCMCDLPGAQAYTSTDAVAHVRLHVARGDRVPDRLLDPEIYIDHGLAGVQS